MSRAVRCYQDSELPKEIVLDTSFVVAMLNAGEPLHAQAASYMQRLARDQVLLIFNRLMEVELVEVAFKLAVKERHGSRGWPSKRNDGRVRRRAGRLTSDLMAAWSDVSATCPTLLIELHEVAHEVPRAMIEWGLASYDAVHASTAIYTQTNAILTLDTDFGSVPEGDLTVYIDHSRVRKCRQRRGGAAP